MTRAVIYARVSTTDQKDNGWGLEKQEDACRRYADAHDFEVVVVFREDISGMTPFTERPEGARLQKLLDSRGADAVLFQCVDRLARDDLLGRIMARRWLENGTEIHFTSIGKIERDNDIKFLIDGWAGAKDREEILARMAGGRRAKLARGMVVGGRLAYGYKHLRDEKGHVVNFEINEDEAAVVRLIYQWYTVGDESGIPLSLRAIAEKLTVAGIATPQKSSRKPFWDPSSLARILSNPTHKGQWEYTDSATDKLPEQTFTIAVPAIVDAETWDAAQVQRERNSRKAKRNGKRDYLLRGIVTCSCGFAFVGRSKSADGVKYYYYECSSRTHYGKRRTCTEKSIRAEKLEAAAWLALRDRLEHSDTLEADMREAQRREDEEREPKTAELNAVLAMMGEAEVEAGKLAKTLQGLTDKQRKGIVGQTLQDKVDALDERYNDLAARRDKLEAELAHRRVTEEAITRTVTYTEGARVGLDSATNEDKRTMLDTFNAQVKVTDGKPVLALWMPDEVLIELKLSRPGRARSSCRGRAWCSSSSSCTPTSSSVGTG